MIYFDHNATTPLDPIAKAAWCAAAEDFPGNPSSPHRIGARADAALTGAREALAGVLGCSPLDLVWTSGASESSNMVWHHAAKTLSPDSEVWLSAIEHPSVLEPARRYFPGRVRLLPMSPNGVVRLDWLARELATTTPGLVALLAANNETGVLQPWPEALALCRERQVPFFCDAVQWIGKLPADSLGQCDFVSGSSHKFGGPKGVGFLKGPRGTRLEPLIYGGPQEDGQRAGTENVAGVLAMVAMIQARTRALAVGDQGQRQAWRTAFETDLVRRLPGARIVGAGQPRLWNTVAAIMPDTDCRQRWVVKLDKLGFAVSTGSACSSGKEAPSHVLSAMGYSAAESARVLRFSAGWDTTPSNWASLLQALEQAHSLLLQRIPS